MQSYSMCLLTTIDWNSSKSLNNSKCFLLDSHWLVPFLHSHLFPCSLDLSFPPPVLPDLSPLLCCQCCLYCPIMPGKRTLERDQAECRLPRKASQCQGLDLTFIYLAPKPLHHNPCWYQDFSSGSKSRKALVNEWIKVTPTSVPSYLKTQRCSWIYAGSFPWEMSFETQPHATAASALCHALFAPFSPE